MNARRLATQRGPQPQEGDPEAPEARHPQGWPERDVFVRQQRPRITPPSSVTLSGRHRWTSPKRRLAQTQHRRPP